MVYQNKVDEMIISLEKKDITDIFNSNVYIPSIGIPNNENQLRVWVNKRDAYLKQARNLPENAFQTVTDNTYNQLTSIQQALADELFIGNEVEFDNEVDWEETVFATIYYYITTP